MLELLTPPFRNSVAGSQESVSEGRRFLAFAARTQSHNPRPQILPTVNGPRDDGLGVAGWAQHYMLPGRIDGWVGTYLPRP
jgi:hypothetical protein